MLAYNSRTVRCTQCGKEISRTARHRKITKKPFCGFYCYGAWQRKHRKGVGRVRVKVACTHCGKVNSKQLCQVLLSGRSFCDGPCYWAWRSEVSFLSGTDNVTWKGGSVGYRGPNWAGQQRAARKRDKNTCQHCDSKVNLAVHHIRPFRLFEGNYKTANLLSNLLTLCGYCHGRAEQAFWKSHPELNSESPFPITPTRVCKDCGKEYVSRSGASYSCDGCCTRQCSKCGKTFYRRRNRNKEAVYCSKKCWQTSHNNPRLTNSLRT